jgi:hypothetical protein
MHTSVIIQTIVSGTHCWPDAPVQVGFLRNPHRHDFYIRVSIREDHDFETDKREHEFFMVKSAMDLWLKTHYPANITEGLDFGTRSCEMIAAELVAYMSAMYHVEWLEVFEDNQNGARITR